MPRKKKVGLVKFIVSALVLAAMTACSTPDAQADKARVDVVRAEDNLQIAKAEAADDVATARVAAAADVDAAKADVVEARAALQAKLDQLDAAILVIEANAKTPEQRDEIVKIRARQNTLVVQVRDRDRDGVNWREVDREVDQVIVDLGRDIETIRVKVVK